MFSLLSGFWEKYNEIQTHTILFIGLSGSGKTVIIYIYYINNLDFHGESKRGI